MGRQQKGYLTMWIPLLLIVGPPLVVAIVLYVRAGLPFFSSSKPVDSDERNSRIGPRIKAFKGLENIPRGYLDAAARAKKKRERK